MERKRLTYWAYPSTWSGFRCSTVNPINNNYLGIYLIEHIPTGFCYIGASSRMLTRISEHASYREDKTKNAILQKAIYLCGREEFGVMPLYVILNPYKKDGLHEAEASLITAYNSVDNGFNTRKAETTEEFRKQIGIHTKASWTDPERRARRLAIGASIETRTKKSVANKGRIRITDGTNEMFLLPTEQIPNNWYRGGVSRKSNKPRSDHHLQSMRNNNLGRFYINNGTINKMIYPHEVIPPGWRLGMKR